jgi:hypothetical protein
MKREKHPLNGYWGYCPTCFNKAYESTARGFSMCAGLCGYIDDGTLRYQEKNTVKFQVIIE